VFHPLVKEFMDRFDLASEEDLPRFFVTSHQIKPEMRVRMQATIQKHIDHSISSTVNCAAETTEEDVARIYFLAWQQGCKGITVYRANSRQNILTAGTRRPAQAAGPTAGPQPQARAMPEPVKAPQPAETPAAAAPKGGEAPAAVEVEVPQPVEAPAAASTAALEAPEPREAPSAREERAPHLTRPLTRARPKVTAGRTERIETPRGRIYVTINEDTQGVCEVFVQSLDVEADAIGRMASLSLRTGADPRDVIEQLWRVQSREVAVDRSVDGTIVRVTTVAQGVALAIGRALYGPGFRPDLIFPMADRLPAPRSTNGHEAGSREGPDPATAYHEASPAVNVTSVEEVQQPLLTFAGVCPDCGSSLIYENGCSSCRSCGYSRC
jgi:ribonucleoside-diphosphate reductase alpha chain